MKTLTNNQKQELKIKFEEAEVQAYLRVAKEIETMKQRQCEATPEEVARAMSYLNL